MTRKVILRPAAERDLRAIIDYTFKRWGAEQAGDYAETIGAAIIRIAQHPEIGPERSVIASGLRKLNVGSHAIYYYYDYKTLRVSRILHSKQDAIRTPFDQ